MALQKLTLSVDFSPASHDHGAEVGGHQPAETTHSSAYTTRVAGSSSRRETKEALRKLVVPRELIFGTCCVVSAHLALRMHYVGLVLQLLRRTESNPRVGHMDRS